MYNPDRETGNYVHRAKKFVVLYQNKRNYWIEEQKAELKNGNIYKYNIEVEKQKDNRNMLLMRQI